MDETASGRAPRAPFWAHLNVFITAFLLLAGSVGGLLGMPIAALADVVLPRSVAQRIVLPAGYLLVALALAWVWRRRGLAPVAADPRQRRRLHLGHGLLAFVSLSMAGGFSLVFLPGVWTPMPRVANAFLLVGSTWPLAAIVGLILVLSVKRLPDASASGFPPTEPGARARRPNAHWPLPEPPPPVWPALAGVLAGLAATGVMAYMALVFGAISFTGRQETFSAVVVPVSMAAFVVYLALAVGLLAFGHRRASLVVAWSPLGLTFLIAPVVQAVGLLAFSAR